MKIHVKEPESLDTSDNALLINDDDDDDDQREERTVVLMIQISCQSHHDGIPRGYIIITVWFSTALRTSASRSQI